MFERKKLTELSRPFICVMISEPTVDDAIKVMKMSEAEGAHAFLVNLMGDGKMGLEKRFLKKEHLKKLFNCTTLPSMACYYRWHYLRGPVPDSDEERMRILLMAVEAGAKCIDMEMDTFDPTPGPKVFSEEAKEYSLKRPPNPPREITYNLEAIKKQQEIIKQVHEMDAEVQMSAHTRVHLTPEQAVEIGKEMERRGADIAKIVSVDNNWDDLLDTLKATIELKKTLKIPFIMMSHGEYGVLARYIAPFLGSMLCFTQYEYISGGFYLQPLTRNVKMVFDGLKGYLPTHDPEELTWL